MDEVEAELLAAGAGAEPIDVRVEERPEKGTVRAVATGAIGLHRGRAAGTGRRSTPTRPGASPRTWGSRPGTAQAVGAYWLAGGDREPRPGRRARPLR